MSHNTKPGTHEENRSVLCGICFRKQGELRSISENQLLQIHSLVDISYNISDIRFQKVLCRICALALTAHTNNPDKPGRKLMHPKYSNLASPSFHSTRQSESKDCPCTVCEIARNNLAHFLANFLKRSSGIFCSQMFPILLQNLSSNLSQLLSQDVPSAMLWLARAGPISAPR